jgi:hypothetical protein
MELRKYIFLEERDPTKRGMTLPLEDNVKGTTV